MNKEFRQRRLFLISSIMALVGGIFVASYAAISIYGGTSSGVSNVTTSLGSRPIFTSTTTDDLDLDVTIIPYVKDVTPTEPQVLDNATGNVTVSLTGSDSTVGDKTKCEFNLMWTWTSDSDSYARLTTSTNTNWYEYTVTITPGTNISGSKTETQLANKTAGTTMVLPTKYTIESASKTMTTGIVNVEIKFYELPGADQSIHAGKNYSGYVSVKNDSVYCSIA